MTSNFVDRLVANVTARFLVWPRYLGLLTILSDSEDWVFSEFLCAVEPDAVMCPVVFSEIEKDELGICGVVWLKILVTGVSGGDILPDNSSFPYGEGQDILGLCKNGRDSENVLLFLSVAMGRCIVL